MASGRNISILYFKMIAYSERTRDIQIVKCIIFINVRVLLSYVVRAMARFQGKYV